MPTSPYPLRVPDTLGCQLWLIDLSHEPAASDWLQCDAQEQARAQRFYFERDARRYRAAHAAMRQLLSHELKQPAADLSWRIDAYGKPHLQGHPGWHSNLSHSADWALLGLHHGAAIGVDLEWCKDIADAPALAAQHFTADEQAALAGADPAVRTTLFYRIWSRKEACLKAAGCGLSTPPCSVAAGAEAQARQVAFTIPDEPGHVVNMTVQSIKLPVPAMAAVAIMQAASPQALGA